MTELTKRKLQFISSHRPIMTDGAYEIAIRQTVSGPGFSDKFAETRRQFVVQGPRFRLNPQDIQAVFPPPGSLGDHDNVLPHIVLKRSTLPWERTADGSSDGAPWLALLLFDEKDLRSAAPDDADPQRPGVQLEQVQIDGDLVTVIDVRKDLLQQTMPTKEELAWLVHVRQNTDEAGEPQGDEVAVVIGNRLPRSGGMSTVHLVSVEGRYQTDRNDFDYQTAEPDDLIRLVSLHHWRFACVSQEHSFKGLLLGLNQQSPFSTLRLPDSPDARANEYLAKGYAPLPHTMRQGNKTISWYRGPLAPGGTSATLEHAHVRAADELVRYNSDQGMFDVSYAAAWELGRLLMIQNKRVSAELFHWKRSHIQKEKVRDGGRHPRHLPIKDRQGALDLPEPVRAWFGDLAQLKGVPFNYLVPDERMLPQESIRFFQVDPLWMACLYDGAFSIGRVLTPDHEHERTLKQDGPILLPGTLSGFLLRSDLVAGWPGLLVDGFSGNRPLELLRMERLSNNVLIGLFDDVVTAVDIHLKPETMHFGINRPDVDDAPYYKRLRYDDGSEGALGDEQRPEVRVTVPFRDAEKETRVIQIGSNVDDAATLVSQVNQLFVNQSAGAEKIAWQELNEEQAPPSAHLALQMIEGVEKVRFTIQ